MIYLDNSATTMVDDRVLETFNKVCKNYPGNSNSLHSLGIKSKELEDYATEKISNLLGVKPSEIIYTSGASESNNTVLKGVASKYRNRGNHIITTHLEHSSVLETCKYLESKGFIIDYVKIKDNGLIDIDDLDKVIVKKWRCWKGDYYTGNFCPIPIYRFLLDTDENQVIDHINGNRSDNRRKNLRVCTQQQNLQNRALSSSNKSGVAGVSFDKQRKKWAAEIRFDYKKCFLGRYENIEDATFVRYYAETQLFKEFRSTRNDERIFKLIEKCFRKEELKKYVDKRLLERFNLNAN